jgi:hypothetical protein
MAGKSPVTARDKPRPRSKSPRPFYLPRSRTEQTGRWPDFAEEITSRWGSQISRSQLSKVLRKKGGSVGAARGTR